MPLMLRPTHAAAHAPARAARAAFLCAPRPHAAPHATRARRRCAAASAQEPAAPPRRARPAGVRIRSAGFADVKPVSELCAAAFAEVPGAIPKGNPAIEGLSEYLEASYMGSMAREVTKAMALSLERRDAAAAEMRRARAARRAAALRTALSALSARAGAAPATAEDAEALQASLLRDADAAPLWPPAERARLLRQRQWICLLATSDADAAAPSAAALIGCMVLSWKVPDAALPPPFPSSRPQRVYVSNMAVASAARRRGVARALLRAAEARATAWGADAIWLHVDASNPGARALYDAAGFVAAREGQDPWWVPAAQRRVLLRKELPALPRGCRSAAK